MSSRPDRRRLFTHGQFVTIVVTREAVGKDHDRFSQINSAQLPILLLDSSRTRSNTSIETLAHRAQGIAAYSQELRQD